MSAPGTKTILITGATGKQGGATLRHLAARGGFQLRALTRKPDSEGARAAAALGAQVVTGDLDDPGSLERALTGVWGVFAVQNSWEAGVVKEEEQGKRLARLAREASVHHFVYTSVGSANQDTGIPHFDSKFAVEQMVKALGFPTYVILRPVFFMENLLAPWALQGDKLSLGIDPATRLQMIASDDIGKFAALAFAQSDARNRTEVDLAGDVLTMPDAAHALGQALGRTVTYQRIPIEAVRQNSEDLARMYEWFDRVGYSAEIAGIQRSWEIQPLKLSQWLSTLRAK
ncbi:MAG TPA: NmrA/HSCARG family protein [Polyangia bacterium]|jgi:uncharacterized protein YbjT (DUF2867 family)|nr:NmrA/HSCARG family protein [Polyangia bacterium]